MDCSEPPAEECDALWTALAEDACNDVMDPNGVFKVRPQAQIVKDLQIGYNTESEVACCD